MKSFHRREESLVRMHFVNFLSLRCLSKMVQKQREENLFISFPRFCLSELLRLSDAGNMRKSYKWGRAELGESS